MTAPERCGVCGWILEEGYCRCNQYLRPGLVDELAVTAPAPDGPSALDAHMANVQALAEQVFFGLDHGRKYQPNSHVIARARDSLSELAALASRVEELEEELSLQIASMKRWSERAEELAAGLAEATTRADEAEKALREWDAARDEMAARIAALRKLADEADEDGDHIGFARRYRALADGLSEAHRLTDPPNRQALLAAVRSGGATPSEEPTG
jgi:hypothetical protein